MSDEAVKQTEDPEYVARLEAAKRASVAQLLFKAARLINEAAVARVQGLGAPGLRVSHTALFPHIDLEGTRPSVLAARLGVSRPAVGKLVADLEAMGVVERVPDPQDGRAFLVCFSAAGRAALFHGLGVLRALEAELVATVGEARWAALHEALLVLVPALESGALAPPEGENPAE